MLQIDTSAVIVDSSSVNCLESAVTFCSCRFGGSLGSTVFHQGPANFLLLNFSAGLQQKNSRCLLHRHPLFYFYVPWKCWPRRLYSYSCFVLVLGCLCGTCIRRHRPRLWSNAAVAPSHGGFANANRGRMLFESVWLAPKHKRHAYLYRGRRRPSDLQKNIEVVSIVSIVNTWLQQCAPESHQISRKHQHISAHPPSTTLSGWM